LRVGYATVRFCGELDTPVQLRDRLFPIFRVFRPGRKR